MKQVVAFLLLLVVAVGGFYVAWPLWSMHRLAEAIRSQDEAVLAAKIDFPSVRASLRPMLTEEVTRRYEQLQAGSSNLRALLATQIKADVLPRLVDIALDSVVTPSNVLRIARNREALKEALQRALEEQIVLGGRRKGGGGEPAKGQPGETSAQQPAPAPSVPVQPRESVPWPRYGYSNIKSVAPVGPLSFEVGFNRNSDSAKAELTATLAFSGYDWKIVSLVPRF
jgi:hypothetical protein